MTDLRTNSQTLSSKFENMLKQEKGFNTYVDTIEQFVQENQIVKTNQLRNLLDKVILIKNSHEGGDEDELSPKTLGKLTMLRPQLHYMAAREPKLKNLVNELNNILKETDNLFKKGKDLNHLYELIASIVAYHKYYTEKQ